MSEQTAVDITLDEREQKQLKKLLQDDEDGTAKSFRISATTLARAATGLRLQPATVEVIRLRLQASKAA